MARNNNRRRQRDSFAEIRFVVLLAGLAFLAVAAIPAVLRAVDVNGDNLDDAWEARYGITTNAYDLAHLVGWWQLDGPTYATDRSTNHIDGILQQFPADKDPFGPGLFGNALNFTPGAQVIFPAIPALDTPGGFTFSTWIKFDDGAGTVATVATWTDVATNSWSLCSGADGGAQLRFTDGQGITQTVGPGEEPITLYNGDWHHVAATMSGYGVVVIYVDGEAQVSGTVTTWKPGPIAAFTFGGTETNAPGYAMDEARLYNRALGPREVTQLPVTYSDLGGNGVSVYEAAQRGLNPYEAYPASSVTPGALPETNAAAASTNLDFTPWMSNPDLDKFLSQYDTVPPGHHPNYWDKGHWMYGVEGRWNNNEIEYRIAYGPTGVHHAGLWWYWWINQPEETFMRRATTYLKDGFVLAHSNYFTMPDGTRRYQGVWHKVVPDKPKTP